MRSLSSTVSEMPSSCEPSRNVVSKISTDSGRVTSFVDMLNPFLVTIDFTSDGARVLLRDRRGHRTGARNLSVVDGVHRADLGGGAADEHLLGDVQVAARQLADADLVTVVARNRHHRALRDALERARGEWRADERTVTGDEDVLAGALGAQALTVGRDR